MPFPLLITVKDLKGEVYSIDLVIATSPWDGIFHLGH